MQAPILSAEAGAACFARLMELHVRALYTMDQNERLSAVNEPWGGGKRAPVFCLARPRKGRVLPFFRDDVPEKLRELALALCRREPEDAPPLSLPAGAAAYCALFAGEPEAERCYLVPESRPDAGAIFLTEETLPLFAQGEFSWLREEFPSTLPCAGWLDGSRAVSVCRSVRITPQAHEAGIETLLEFRGRGYAEKALAAWADAVRKSGAFPLYSTGFSNRASQRVAGKAGLLEIGEGFAIWRETEF